VNTSLNSFADGENYSMFSSSFLPLSVATFAPFAKNCNAEFRKSWQNGQKLKGIT
jgi:hypothetical protein